MASAEKGLSWRRWKVYSAAHSLAHPPHTHTHIIQFRCMYSGCSIWNNCSTSFLAAEWQQQLCINVWWIMYDDAAADGNNILCVLWCVFTVYCVVYGLPWYICKILWWNGSQRIQMKDACNQMVAPTYWEYSNMVKQYQFTWDWTLDYDERKPYADSFWLD